MKQQVLKALANPSRIFYVPYTLAVLNFVSLFIIYMVISIVVMVFSAGHEPPSPLYFLITVIITHTILAAISKRDPQIGQIIAAKIQMIKNKIPGRLAA